MRFLVRSLGCVSEETLARNRAASPNLPEPSGSGPLAVVGGGPSIVAHIDELRNWNGDIWAINGAHAWCVRNGISAWFMSVDPQPVVADLILGADRSVLADHCDPAVFACAVNARKAKWSVGPTSACSASLIGVNAGYSSVTWFGCESSFGETTHAYMNDDVPDLCKVRVGKDEFLTELEYLCQAEILAELIRQAPMVFSEKSGGLLRALINNPEHEFVAVAKTVKFPCTCPTGRCIEELHGKRPNVHCMEAA